MKTIIRRRVFASVSMPMCIAPIHVQTIFFYVFLILQGLTDETRIDFLCQMGNPDVFHSALVGELMEAATRAIDCICAKVRCKIERLHFWNVLLYIYWVFGIKAPK